MLNIIWLKFGAKVVFFLFSGQILAIFVQKGLFFYLKFVQCAKTFYLVLKFLL